MKTIARVGALAAAALILAAAADGSGVDWSLRFHVKTGSLPKGVVLTPAGDEAWVTNFGHDKGHNLTVYDAFSGKVKKQVSFSGRAVEIAFSPDGSTAYVSNFDTGRLMFIDAKTHAVRNTIKVGTNPKIVTLSPTGDRVYVSNWSSNTVSVIDPAEQKVIGTVQAGTNPRGSDTDPSGKLLFVANFNGHTLSVVDTETMKQIKVIKMRAYPRHVTTTPDGRYVLVSNMGKASSEIAVVDPVGLAVVKWIKVGAGPKVITVTPDSRFAYTADYVGNSVSIVDLQTLTRIGAIPNLGKACCGMDLSGDGTRLYVTSWYSNELWSFDLEYPPPQSEPDGRSEETVP